MALPANDPIPVAQAAASVPSETADRERLGRHIPVMAEEIVGALQPRSGGRYVDGTLGEGGMAEMLLERCSPDGDLLGFDWDASAHEICQGRLARFGSRIRYVHDSFVNVRGALRSAGWEDGADGIMVDLGVSTLQFGKDDRGFSFQVDAPLDMRMDRRLEKTAADLLAELPEKELADILYLYGEERASRRIARQVVRRRLDNPVKTTTQLQAAVRAAGVKTRPGIDPATRTFQALRIAVNQELDQIAALLERGWELLRPGGRLAILSYHSLEDRLVKQAFAMWSADCLCPPRQPVCNCGWSAKVRRVTRGKQKPSDEEIVRNPRARSAGLRVVERLAA
jgi:16S rRNA (cytosine1402-N4)-methyltransferase